MTDVDDGRPAQQDLVDVLLDSATEALVATVTRVDGDTVLIDAPVHHSGRVVLPSPGEGGLMIWRGARAMQQAPMAVLDVTRPPSPVWKVHLTEPGVPCQRRTFVRADTNLAVLLRHGQDVHAATAIDLSEGGMRCRTQDPLPLGSGEQVSVEVTMDGEATEFSARLVRVRHTDGMPTDVGLSFTGMRIADADRVRRFVFEQLRRQRSSGLS